jgi:hypothetical protein
MKRSVNLPSGAIRDSQVVAELPLVLAVEIVFIGIGVNDTASTLTVTVGIAEQEVEPGITG